MTLQRLDHTGHGEADDVIHRSLDTLDQPPPILLGCVRTGLIERVNFAQVFSDQGLVEWTKGDTRRLHKAAALDFTSTQHADACEHLMRSATESAQHFHCVIKVTWFTKNLPIEHDHGVCPEDHIPEYRSRELQSLHLGISEDQGSRRKPV